MPSLTECMNMIADLAKEMGWGSDPATKIYYAMIELGEAGDAWKHRTDVDYLWDQPWYRKLYKGSIDVIPDTMAIKKHIREELIDVIFYCLHAMWCLSPECSPDQEFLDKFEINRKRAREYPDDADTVEEEMDE